ncbi:MAG TPA: FIST N-terminal domain-containing protein, partial [Actinomycetota bacterium]|nr:FIST N-terminal domain-containing protein [Actinomycetota bacterium]
MDTRLHEKLPAGKTGPRWMGVGHSNDADPRKAGASAAAGAIRGDEAKLLVVFCSDSYDLSELSAGVRSAAPGVPLIGCSTAGEIATGGPAETSVVVTALGGPGFTVHTNVATEVSSRLRDAGAEVAGPVLEICDRAYKVLMLLTDGLAGDQQEIVRGAYSVVGGGVPLVGGCAGDDLKMIGTRQLFDDRVLEDAIVAAAIGSDAPLGIGVRHGWRKVGEPMLVTRSSDNRVYMLDDRPALDVYLERLNAPEEARRDAAAFTRFALTHPLGLQGRSEEPHVRFIGEASFADRSLGCIAEVPQSALAWIMEGDEDSVLQATDAACAEALDALDGQRPLGMIAFDCIARRGVLGEPGIATEIERVAEHAEGAPVSGFYTYGE